MVTIFKDELPSKAIDLVEMLCKLYPARLLSDDGFDTTQHLMYCGAVRLVRELVEAYKYPLEEAHGIVEDQEMKMVRDFIPHIQKFPFEID